MICVMGILGFEVSFDCNVHMLVEMSKVSFKLMVGDEQGSCRHSLFVFVVVFGVDASCGADFKHVLSWCQSLCIVLQLRFGEYA